MSFGQKQLGQMPPVTETPGGDVVATDPLIVAVNDMAQQTKRIFLTVLVVLLLMLVFIALSKRQ